MISSERKTPNSCPLKWFLLLVQVATTLILLSVKINCQPIDDIRSSYTKYPSPPIQGQVETYQTPFYKLSGVTKNLRSYGARAGTTSERAPVASRDSIDDASEIHASMLG